MMHSPDRQHHALHMWELNHLDDKKSQVIVNDSKLLPLSLSHNQNSFKPAVTTVEWAALGDGRSGTLHVELKTYYDDDDGDHIY